MSRTYRKVDKNNWLRHPRTTQIRRESIAILDELEETEFDITVSNRLKKQANPHNDFLPDLYDDIFIAALSEDKSWKK